MRVFTLKYQHVRNSNLSRTYDTPLMISLSRTSPFFFFPRKKSRLTYGFSRNLYIFLQITNEQFFFFFLRLRCIHRRNSKEVVYSVAIRRKRQQWKNRNFDFNYIISYRLG